jgi:hypothetical protein
MTALTLPSCRAERPRLVAGLRLRPVPELETCIVYRTRPPALLLLNLSAWLLVEILSEGGEADLWSEFHAAVGHASQAGDARKMMQEGLQQLASFGLLESGTTTPTGDSQ